MKNQTLFTRILKLMKLIAVLCIWTAGNGQEFEISDFTLKILEPVNTDFVSNSLPADFDLVAELLNTADEPKGLAMLLRESDNPGLEVIEAESTSEETTVSIGTVTFFDHFFDPGEKVTYKLVLRVNAYGEYVVTLELQGEKIEVPVNVVENKLTIEKSALDPESGTRKDTFDIGDTIEYEVKFNLDFDSAEIFIIDYLPEGLDFLQLLLDTSVCSYNENLHTVVCGPEILDRGIYYLVYRCVATNEGVFTNNVIIEANDHELSIIADDSATVHVLNREADISIFKSSDKENYEVWDTIEYQIKVTNYGPKVATNVRVTDFLPSSILNLEWECSGEGQRFGNSCVWPSIGVGEESSETISIKGIIQLPGEISNTAFVEESDRKDGNPENDTSTVIVLANEKSVDLALSKNAQAFSEDEWEFVIEVINDDDFPAFDVRVTDLMPARFTVTGINGGDGLISQMNDQIRCTWTQVAAKSKKILRITAKVPGNGTFVNTVFRDTSASPDPNPENDTARIEFEVDIPCRADLKITNEYAGRVPITVGTQYIYQVSGINCGPHDADSVVISDTLPEGFRLINRPLYYLASAPAFSTQCDTMGQVVKCLIPQLAAHDTVYITAIIGIADSIGDPVINVAHITSACIDDSLQNNRAEYAVEIAPDSADLSLEVMINPDSLEKDTIFEMLIRATNHGPNFARNVQIIDTIPEYFEVVEVLTAGCTYDSISRVITCQPEILAPGMSTHVLVDLMAIRGGKLLNEAHVEVENDPNLSNNKHSDYIYLDFLDDFIKEYAMKQTSISVRQRQNNQVIEECLASGWLCLKYTPALLSKFVTIYAENPVNEKEILLFSNRFLSRTGKSTNAEGECYSTFIGIRFDSLGIKDGQVLDSLTIKILVTDPIDASISEIQMRVGLKVSKLDIKAGLGFNDNPPPDVRFPSESDPNRENQRGIIDLDTFYISEFPNLDLDSVSNPAEATYAGDFGAAPVSTMANALEWMKITQSLNIVDEHRPRLSTLDQLTGRDRENGTAFHEMIKGTLTYIRDNNLPVQIDFQSKLDSTGADVILQENIQAFNQNEANLAGPEWNFLKEQLNKGNAVVLTFDRWFRNDTLEYGSSAVNVVGYYESPDEKIVLYQDDVNQASAGGLGVFSLAWIDGENNSFLMSDRDASLLHRVISIVSIGNQNTTPIVEVESERNIITSFPNPARNIVNVISPDSPAGLYSFYLINQVGVSNSIGSMKLNRLNTTINISLIPPGSYHLLIQLNREFYGVSKLIVY